MRFRCYFDYYPCPTEPHEFIRSLVIDVICRTALGHDVLAARLAVDHLDLLRVSVAGERLDEVCDADSTGWAAVYAALFEPNTNPSDPQLRAEFNCPEPVFHLLLIDRSVFHERLRPWQAFILHHVSELLGESSATVMWQGVTTLTALELARLGFRRVVGEQLLFRHNMLLHAYSPDEEAAEVWDLDLPADADSWVAQRWSEGE